MGFGVAVNRAGLGHRAACLLSQHPLQVWGTCLRDRPVFPFPCFSLSFSCSSYPVYSGSSVTRLVRPFLPFRISGAVDTVPLPPNHIAIRVARALRQPGSFAACSQGVVHQVRFTG